MNIILKKENREIFWKLVGLNGRDITKFIAECKRIGWEVTSCDFYECDRVANLPDYKDSCEQFHKEFNWGVL